MSILYPYGFVLLAILLCPAAIAQVQWQIVPPAPGGPGPRNGASMEYAPIPGGMVLYAGWDQAGSPVDMWSWDGSAWSLLDANPPPGMRWGHMMSYDLARLRMVIFGGARGFYINDIWEWDVLSSTWIQLFPANPPAPRAAARMVYDTARGVHVLFGGSNFSGYFDDTWEWNGLQWHQVPTAVRPTMRASFAMAYDALRRRVVVHGGVTANNIVLGDLWEFDGAAWSQRLPAASPAPRGWHAMAYDPIRGRSVIFGGHDGPMEYRETWEWDGSQWYPRTTSAMPGGTFEACLAYDHTHQQIVHFGGTGSGGGRTQTGLYAATQPAAVQPIGWGCPGSAGIPRLWPEGNQLPWLGDTVTTTVSPVVGAGAVLVAGLAMTGPNGLGSYGWPGCYSFVTLDVAVFAAAMAGSASFSLGVPNRPGLLGVPIYQQALTLDPLAVGGAVTSNGIELRVGGR